MLYVLELIFIAATCDYNRRPTVDQEAFSERHAHMTACEVG